MRKQFKGIVYTSPISVMYRLLPNWYKALKQSFNSNTARVSTELLTFKYAFLTSYTTYVSNNYVQQNILRIFTLTRLSFSFLNVKMSSIYIHRTINVYSHLEASCNYWIIDRCRCNAVLPRAYNYNKYLFSVWTLAINITPTLA